MKYRGSHLYLLLIFFIFSASSWAQNGFNYQAALRYLDGKPIADSTFTLNVDILEGRINGVIVYSERHTATTNTLGLFQLVIGSGITDDVFEDIPWGNNDYFIALKINNQTFNVSQLLSVPYAMHAYSAGKITDINEPTEKSYTDSLYNVINDKIDVKNPVSKAYVDSITQDIAGISASLSGDTLVVGNDKLFIPGVSSKNATPYPNQKCFGGNGNEIVKATLPGDSGRTIIIAETNSRNGDVEEHYGNNDIWIFEIDASMNIIWQTTLGGSRYDNFSLAKRLPNGNILLTGTTESNNGTFSKNSGKFDAWLAELSILSHTIEWETTFGGTQTEFVNDLIVFSDGGFIVGGSTFSDDYDINENRGISDIWIAQYDKLKTKVWSKAYGENRFESLHRLFIKPNGNILVIGETESNSSTITGNNGGLDILCFELDKNGNILNQICLGTSENEESINIVYEKGMLYLTGISFASDWDQVESASAQNVFYATLNDDLSGKKIDTFGGSQSEWPLSLIRKKDKSYMLCTTASNSGDINSNYGDYDYWLFDINANDIDFQKNFGGSLADEATILYPTEDGFIVVGNSESNDGDLTSNNGMKDVWIVKTDENFNIIKQLSFGGTQNEAIYDIAYEGSMLTLFCTTMSNDYGIKNFHGKPGSNSDIWIVKTEF